MCPAWLFQWLGKCQVLWSQVARTMNGWEGHGKLPWGNDISTGTQGGAVYSSQRIRMAIAPPAQLWEVGTSQTFISIQPCHMRIVFKYRFWFSRSSVHWESTFPKSSQGCYWSKALDGLKYWASLHLSFPVCKMGFQGLEKHEYGFICSIFSPCHTTDQILAD